MQYSIVGNKKVQAQPGLQGICECCHKPTYSACGKVIKWHWRHKDLKNCDSWWENETQWHRDWKEKFPEDYREIICFDSVTGEKHIADIKTNTDIVIEFQNSPISTDELKSREEFYDKLIWVVNAEKFSDNIIIGFKLPNPKSTFPENIDFANSDHFLPYDKFKYPDGTREYSAAISEKFLPLVEQQYLNHHRLTWKYKRKVWLEAKSPVFLDFGDDKLWRIQQLDRFENFPTTSWFKKDAFIAKYR